LTCSHCPDTMCTRESCGFCRFLSHMISLGAFRFLLAALLVMNLVSVVPGTAPRSVCCDRSRVQSLGLFWLFYSMDMRDETPFRFASECLE
jgi:hypothetical protein